jgi:MOSC domain-containing protein YiiM
MPNLGPYQFSETDVLRTFANLGAWWDHIVSGLDAAPTIPAGNVLAEALSAAGGVPRNPSHSIPEELEVLGRSASERFAKEASAPASVALLEQLWKSIREAMSALRDAGVLTTGVRGTVTHLNVSDGGVPKRHVDAVDIGFRGISGDRQGNRTFHGRPWQALCLWSTEIIESFAAEGHPIAPGRAGENITVRGIGWADMRPGLLLRIGTVLAETSSWAIPCRHNAQWFADGDFRRMSHERGPVSRIYATVLEPGRVAVGDDVVIS